MADNSGWPWPGVLSIGAPNFANALPPAFWNDLSAGKDALSRLYNSMPGAPMQLPGAQPSQPAGTVQTQDDYGNPTGGPAPVGNYASLVNQASPGLPPGMTSGGNPSSMVANNPGGMWPTPPAGYTSGGAPVSASSPASPTSSPASAATSPPVPPRRPKATPNLGRYPPPPSQRFIPIQWQAASGGPSSGALAPTQGSRAPIYTALNLFGRG